MDFAAPAPRCQVPRFFPSSATPKMLDDLGYTQSPVGLFSFLVRGWHQTIPKVFPDPSVHPRDFHGAPLCGGATAASGDTAVSKRHMSLSCGGGTPGGERAEGE